LNETWSATLFPSNYCRNPYGTMHTIYCLVDKNGLKTYDYCDDNAEEEIRFEKAEWGDFYSDSTDADRMFNFGKENNGLAYCS
jgi:hypothetical protein